MATVESILGQLHAKGSEKTRQTLIRHGMPANRVYGVSVADLKTMAKSIKGDQALALALFDTGNVDAMYLAGIVADGRGVTDEQLNRWASLAADAPMISEYSVPWMAVEAPDPWAVAERWVDAPAEGIQASGWCTLTGLVTLLPDDRLDFARIESFLERTVERIGAAPNRARLCMNSFVIAVGRYVAPLRPQALAAAEAIGQVDVDMGKTACKIPDAVNEIRKAGEKPSAKRKTIRC